MLVQARRAVMYIVSAISMIIILSACGSTVTPENNVEKPNVAAIQSTSIERVIEPQQEGNEGETKTRVVPTVMGEIEVPADPQRVVVLFNIGDVLAFGVTPIAVDKFQGQVYYDEIAHIEERPSWSDPEGMMEQNPDLIILWGDHFYDSLKAIAPVIVMPDDLTERITLLGEVFGKQDQATALLQAYEDKLQAARERIQELSLADKTFTVMEENFGEGGAVTMWYKSQAYNVIYSDLGLQANQKFVEDFPESTHPGVSLEVVPQYAGEYIFHSKGEEGDTISQSPIWESLEAVQQGRVMELDADMFYWADIQSATAQLEAIMQGLESMSLR